jgi:hypothetical protein
VKAPRGVIDKGIDDTEGILSMAKDLGAGVFLRKVLYQSKYALSLQCSPFCDPLMTTGS